MPGLAAFFGKIYLLAIIGCGLLWLFAPKAGHELAKRTTISVLLFVAGSLSLPAASSGLLFGMAGMVTSFLLFLAAVYYLFDVKQAQSLLGLLLLATAVILVLWLILCPSTTVL